MHDDVTRTVYEVLRSGLRFKDHLERNRRLSLEAVQGELKSRLHGLAAQGRGGDGYLGVRYPLVCWLDETFIIDSPWANEWNQKALEVELFEERIRGPRFWRQADAATARSDKDTLEAFLLCLLLGFRGDLRDDLPALRDRRDKFESLIGLRKLGEWRDIPPELPPPPTDVPELYARARLGRVLLALGLAVGVAIVALVFTTVFSGF